MSRHVKLVVSFVATLCTAVAFAQAVTAPTDGTVQDGASPVAYVYVSNSNQNVYAFAAAPDGKLTPVPGSPFRVSFVAGMAVNAKYLFLTDEVYIYTFSVAPDGSIEQVASINAQQFNDGGCGGPEPLFIDRTGTTLYDVQLQRKLHRG